ncbi:hypothetical protein DIC66_05685 [Rhodoferax lacus]|uniref:UPF0276 protein DIC66_05685 n=1 Tax=Rhodoferax lacus TaxID=2184758 RepID=A0A3E1RFS7_9BURK|nr:DUF692 domain-containing protein [Rhodoferax lacus]RFO98204.1 hypothetical protein DIC66_05685 [Rhodoferax lacus]
MHSIQGFGLGLRTEHYAAFESEHQTRVDWLEILSENYMVPGGAPLWHLDRIRRDFPMVMHGVSLNIGGTDALNQDYLRDLKALVQRVQPGWVSDHLCWTGTQGINMHDLLPLPYTEETLRHVTDRILRVQDFLGQRLVLENPSTYVAFASNQMPEWEFIGEMLRRADCELLLDVNNVYVSSVNHGFDPHVYIDAIPASRVRQIHLAGHETHGAYLIDTHDQPVCEAVWQLYGYTLQRCGSVPTMIERDDDIPALQVLLDELDHARVVQAQALATAAAPLECAA